MAVSEGQRHQLYVVAESVFGTEGAATMMELLPPTGWADVARKNDMDRLEVTLKGEMGSLEARLSERIDSMGNHLRAEFYKSQESQLRLIIFSMVTCMSLVATLAFGAAKLV